MVKDEKGKRRRSKKEQSSKMKFDEQTQRWTPKQ